VTAAANTGWAAIEQQRGGRSEEVTHFHGLHPWNMSERSRSIRDADMRARLVPVRTWPRNAAKC